MRAALIVTGFCLAAFPAAAIDVQPGIPPAGDTPSIVIEGIVMVGPATDSLRPRENNRLVAAVLAIFLGPFGAHRLYLGTQAKVPIIYGITFGGFGVLAVIDLCHILFTKDLSRYRHNGRVFMWARPMTVTTPP